MPQNFNMMHDTWWDVAWCMMHDPWSMRQDYTWWDPSCRSESSNYKLGRLDKEKFADHTRTHGQYHIWRQTRCLKNTGLSLEILLGTLSQVLTQFPHLHAWVMAVTIIHSSTAPNDLLRPLTVVPKSCIKYVHFWGEVGGRNKNLLLQSV